MAMSAKGERTAAMGGPTRAAGRPPLHKAARAYH
jgi:hypothetical protein